MVFKVRFKVTNPNGSRDRDIEKKSLGILLVTKTPKQKASIIIYLMNLSLVLLCFCDRSPVRSHI